VCAHSDGDRGPLRGRTIPGAEREFFIDNLLVRIHFIIMMIRWTGLAPWKFEFPFPGSLTSTFLGSQVHAFPSLGWALGFGGLGNRVLLGLGVMGDGLGDRGCGLGVTS